jgi:uncharacterized protein YggE
MSDPAGPLLSVRGDARQTVAPDYVILAGVISSSQGSKEEALRAVASGLDHLTSGLASLGGLALGPETGRRPLTWSARSATTRVERDHDNETGRYEATGQVTATVLVVIAVRSFEMLDALGAALATQETLNLREVTWGVDWDNPAWPDVRAAAIQAAIRKGRDYAGALGGALYRVEHIADVGLLGGNDNAPYRFTGSSAALAASRGGDEGDVPSLDPVPQELTATIEARFTATGVSLTEL